MLKFWLCSSPWRVCETLTGTSKCICVGGEIGEDEARECRSRAGTEGERQTDGLKKASSVIRASLIGIFVICSVLRLSAFQARDADARQYADRIASDRVAAAAAISGDGDTSARDAQDETISSEAAKDISPSSSKPSPSSASTASPALRKAELFGGAIEVDVPANYVDAR